VFERPHVAEAAWRAPLLAVFGIPSWGSGGGAGGRSILFDSVGGARATGQSTHFEAFNILYTA
jgi:hypothetical protein